jgi:hypothetical protein
MKLAERLYTLREQEKQRPATAKEIKQDGGRSNDKNYTEAPRCDLIYFKTIKWRNVIFYIPLMS